MTPLDQKLIPGLVGISTYVDFAYQKAMQLAALGGDATKGPINRLRTVTATLDFRLLIDNLRGGRKDDAEEQVAVACATLAAGGANFIVVTSGTTSTLTTRARQRVALPFLDIAEASFKPARPQGPVGLLCTRYTTTGGMFHAAAKRHATDIVMLAEQTGERVDRAIFDDLVGGAVSESGLRTFAAAIGELKQAGAASIILGNTDLTLIADDLRRVAQVPLIDSAVEHARAAAHAALTGNLG
jgi:aspartate racemase